MAHEKIGPRVYVYNMAFRKRFSVSEVLKEVQDLSDEEVFIEHDSDRESDQGEYLDDVEPDSDGDSDGSSGNTEPYDPPEAASVHVAVADQQTASAARVWSDPGDSVPRMDFPYIRRHAILVAPVLLSRASAWCHVSNFTIPKKHFSQLATPVRRRTSRVCWRQRTAGQYPLTVKVDIRRFTSRASMGRDGTSRCIATLDKLLTQCL